MQFRKYRFRVGLRTVKTALAVIISMVLVYFYGTSDSRLIFAMLGAMAAVMPTFKESLESCLTQISGVVFGALIGVLLMALPLHPLLAIGMGIVLIISLYNTFRIRFSPTLPCLILVTICIAEEYRPFTYAVGRIWDTAIGLIVGMLINMLIFPYDNSSQIRLIIESFERDVLRFLEEMFDGDDILPDPQKMTREIDDMARQLTIFGNQKLLLHLRRQKAELETFKLCEGKARVLLARLEVLSRMGELGLLTKENKDRLIKCGANIRDERILTEPTERDIVINYHIRQILSAREELLEVLKKLS